LSGADFSGGGSFGGDLSVEGNLSIGGTFGGSVNITDVTAAEIIATGIISGTTSSSATLHDTTITGNLVQSAGKNLSVGQNLSIGGTTTFGSQINFGDATTQVSAAGTLFANLSGIITTGAITVGDLDVGGNFNYTGGSIATFGSILLNGVSGFVSCKSLDAGTGIISCTGLNARTGEITGGGLNLTGPTTSNNYFQSTAGVSTFFDIDITGGNNSNLKLTRLGFNTSLSTLGITEGIALWDNAEIFVDDSPGGGIGIGTTAGKRDSSVALYVGYGRDASGNFINGETVFEGGVGIGTMVGNNDGNMLEVYKETVFHSYHTGRGGTDAGPARVGYEWNTVSLYTSNILPSLFPTIVPIPTPPSNTVSPLIKLPEASLPYPTYRATLLSLLPAVVPIPIPPPGESSTKISALSHNAIPSVIPKVDREVLNPSLVNLRLLLLPPVISISKNVDTPAVDWK
jgi:hypothetical protein